jgi:hypothetical protein
MKLAEAVCMVERACSERAQDGRNTEIQQIDCEFADACTAMAYVYFLGDDEPAVLLVDLEMSVTEETFDRAALKQALLISTPASVVH